MELDVMYTTIIIRPHLKLTSITHTDYQHTSIKHPKALEIHHRGVSGVASFGLSHTLSAIGNSSFPKSLNKPTTLFFFRLNQTNAATPQSGPKS